MRVELLPGMTNVVRFPVERRARPTLELLRGIAPDVREVLNLAEAFGMEMPLPDLRSGWTLPQPSTSQIRSPRAAPSERRCCAS